jgi:hemerythrin-like domain-containing protein
MKRHEALALLSSDHHHGLSIAKMVRSGERINSEGTAEIYKKLTDFFNNELVKHFSEEEAYLVPPLKGNILIMRMCEEHKQLRDIFASLGSTDDMEDTLITFGKMLESHIRFEERELFPMIENTLPEKTLIEIGNLIKFKKGAN